MGKTMNRKAIDILLVEDNPGDVILVRQALKAAGATVRLHAVSNGAAALEFVRKQDPRPHLIILDMNLPEKSGAEVLQELKVDATFKEIPVVVFSTSSAAADVRSAYSSHASSYVQKPEDVDEFFAAIAGIERYWANTVLLPTV